MTKHWNAIVLRFTGAVVTISRGHMSTNLYLTLETASIALGRFYCIRQQLTLSPIDAKLK